MCAAALLQSRRACASLPARLHSRTAHAWPPRVSQILRSLAVTGAPLLGGGYRIPGHCTLTLLPREASRRPPRRAPPPRRPAVAATTATGAAYARSRSPLLRPPLPAAQDYKRREVSVEAVERAARRLPALPHAAAAAAYVSPRTPSPPPRQHSPLHPPRFDPAVTQPEWDPADQGGFGVVDLSSGGGLPLPFPSSGERREAAAGSRGAAERDGLAADAAALRARSERRLMEMAEASAGLDLAEEAVAAEAALMQTRYTASATSQSLA